MKTMLEIKSYLDMQWAIFRWDDGTPERFVFGDALSLWGTSSTPRDYIARLKRNRDRVKNAKRAFPEREYRKELVNWYNIIIAEIQED